MKIIYIAESPQFDFRTAYNIYESPPKYEFRVSLNIYIWRS